MRSRGASDARRYNKLETDDYSISETSLFVLVTLGQKCTLAAPRAAPW